MKGDYTRLGDINHLDLVFHVFIPTLIKVITNNLIDDIKSFKSVCGKVVVFNIIIVRKFEINAMEFCLIC